MGSKRVKERKQTADQARFDGTALARLTSKIEKSLADSAKTPPPKRKRGRDNDDGHGSKRRQTGAADGASEPEHRGERPERQAPSLLDEIVALGGDETDLELVANVDSGDEGGPPPRAKLPTDLVVDNSLRDELAKFASGLGFGRFTEAEDPETDEDPDEPGAVAPSSRGSAGEEDVVDGATESDHVRPSQQEVRREKPSNKLVFEPRPDWYGLPQAGPTTRAPDNASRHARSIENMKAYAEALLESDSTAYHAMRAKSSSQKFMSTIMSSGTLSDKVSALTLSIQESPLHNRKAFENLITLAGKRSRGQAIAALGALVDLLGNGAVLPDDRRLQQFNAQPALLGTLDGQGSSHWAQGHQLPGMLTKAHLMMWAYEDWLKRAYFRIIQLLEVWSSDEIEYSRTRALDFVFGLLKNKPEQEANLLRLLVNKLGDRERKIASRASYLVLQLLNIHPGMKPVVISAVEQEILLKPGQTLRTKYTAINTLNQTILSTKESATADMLLRIYFDIFLSLLRTKSLDNIETDDGQMKSDRARRRPRGKGGFSAPVPGNEQETAQKLVSSLLTGVNRAVPFASAEDSTLESHLDTLFKITHSSNFNTSVQALMLIQQLTASKQLAVDRFYRTLYESLLDPRLVTSSKHALYLNLLFRALKNDVDVRRVKAFVKRLIQVLSLHQPSFTCGILFLVAELKATFPDLHTLLDEAEDNDDDGEEVYLDVREGQVGAESVTRGASETMARRLAVYDGRKRDPEHSNAHRSCLWEFVPFLSHYHPSVCVFAANLLTRQKVLPKPDLASHTLIHFLDKFVYRNPKAEESQRGGSIMQPILASGGASHIVASNKAAARQLPMVNSSSFWNLKPDQVSAEDVFFHEYFARVGKPGEAARTAEKPAVDQAETGEEAAEEEIWEALVNSQPEIEGDDAADDSSVDLDGLDYSDDDEQADDGLDADEAMSDFGSEGAEGDAAFEGIFDASEDDDSGANSSDDQPVKQGRQGRLSRKEMRNLPTFASADDYAGMLGAEDGDLDD